MDLERDLDKEWKRSVVRKSEMTMTRKSARLDSTKLGMDGRHRVELQTSAMATVETLVPSTKQRVTAILHHGECMRGSDC